MAQNIAHLEIRLSGGAGNTNPNASLGGDVSSERVLSQSHSALSNITGVTIEYAAGNALGAGTLAYTHSGQTLTWTPFGGAAGSAVAVGVDGKYTIKGSSGFLLVSVVASSLPGTNQNDSVTIANIANETFDDVTKTESYNGDTEYRCFYVKNTHPTDSFLDVVLFIQTQPNPGTLSVGKDPAGAGDGLLRSVTNLTRSGSVATATVTGHPYVNGNSVTIAGADQSEYNGTFVISNVTSNTFDYTITGSPASPATGTITAKRGRAVVVADESTAPAGVTFSTPTSELTGVQLGEIKAGEVAAFWERRTIPVRNTTTNSASTSLVGMQAYY